MFIPLGHFVICISASNSSFIKATNSSLIDGDIFGHNFHLPHANILVFSIFSVFFQAFLLFILLFSLDRPGLLPLGPPASQVIHSFAAGAVLRPFPHPMFSSIWGPPPTRCLFSSCDNQIYLQALPDCPLRGPSLLDQELLPSVAHL